MLITGLSGAAAAPLSPPPQARRWLEASAGVFLSILDAEDLPAEEAGPALEAIWKGSFVATGGSPMVQHLVSALMPKQEVRGAL